MNGRQARIERKTKETEVAVQLNLDGTGSSKVQTPIPFTCVRCSITAVSAMSISDSN